MAATSTFQPTKTAAAAAASKAICSALVSVGENAAFSMLMALAGDLKTQGHSSADIHKALLAASKCRQWPTKLGDLKQLLARYPNGASGGGADCDCKTPTPSPTHPENQPMNPDFIPTPCGVVNAPDVSSMPEMIANGCAANQCVAGYLIGLERIPQTITLPPVTTVISKVSYTRPARMIGMSLIKRDTTWLTDNVLIGSWQTSLSIQAYDKMSDTSTFNTEDPNTLQFPSRIYLENGDSDFSPMLHKQNPLPPFVPLVNIGKNNSYVQFSTQNVDAAATYVLPILFWIYFTEGASAD